MTPTDAFLSTISRKTMPETVQTILGWLQSDKGCRHVATANMDFLRLYNEHSAFQMAFSGADLKTADGMPVRWAARAPERVTGADMVPALLEASRGSGVPLRPFILGGENGSARKAAGEIEETFGVRVAGWHEPVRGFEDNEAENQYIISKIRKTRANLLLVALGAPKQELWIARHRGGLSCAVAIGVGAAIDFLAGRQFRAPRWMQVMWLEWLWRMCSDPARLAGRYYEDSKWLPELAAYRYGWRSVRRRRLGAVGEV